MFKNIRIAEQSCRHMYYLALLTKSDQLITNPSKNSGPLRTIWETSGAVLRRTRRDRDQDAAETLRKTAWNCRRTRGGNDANPNFQSADVDHALAKQPIVACRSNSFVTLIGRESSVRYVMK